MYLSRIYKAFGSTLKTPEFPLLFQPLLPFIPPLRDRPSTMYALAVLSVAVLAGQGELALNVSESDQLLTFDLQRLPPPSRTPALSPPF